MFSIENIRILPPNYKEKIFEEEQRTFLSHSSKGKLVFKNPIEFRMGATSWDVKLYLDNKDVTKRHSFLSMGQFMLPIVYQPWVDNGSRVFLLDKKGCGKIYDLDSQEIYESDVDNCFIAINGCEGFSKYFVVRNEEIYLIGNTGKILKKLNYKVADNEYPFVAWVDHSYFLIVGRENKNTLPNLTFFDVEKEEIIDTYIVDPLHIVPYQQEKFKALNRDGFTLALSKSIWTVGRFLDTWAGFEFDRDKLILRLKIYRPSSEIYTDKKYGNSFCDVMAVWVEIKLNRN